MKLGFPRAETNSSLNFLKKERPTELKSMKNSFPLMALISIQTPASPIFPEINFQKPCLLSHHSYKSYFAFLEVNFSASWFST